MKIELNKKINEVISAHRNNNKQCIEDMREILNNWENPQTRNKYNADYVKTAIQEELNAVVAEAYKTDIVLSQKAKSIIAEAKKEVLPFVDLSQRKISDYAMQINNAIQFIRLEGKELTDDKAYKILKSFIDDFEQMDLFADMVEKQVGTEKFINSSGECNFIKTFGMTNRIKTLLNLFNDVEGIVENLFLFPKVDAEYFIIDNIRYTVKQDGYSEISAEENTLNLCGCITNIADSMASPTMQEL